MQPFPSWNWRRYITFLVSYHCECEDVWGIFFSSFFFLVASDVKFNGKEVSTTWAWTRVNVQFSAWNEWIPVSCLQFQSPQSAANNAQIKMKLKGEKKLANKSRKKFSRSRSEFLLCYFFLPVNLSIKTWARGSFEMKWIERLKWMGIVNVSLWCDGKKWNYFKLMKSLKFFWMTRWKNLWMRKRVWEVEKGWGNVGG